MSNVLIEIVFISLLIVANGLLAMSEIAVVSARRARLQQQAGSGNKGARLALELAQDPDRFLSTVQIGITLVGILAGAFGGATLSRELSAQLGRISPLAPYSDAISIGLVVIGITYLSLVFGELVPKRLALNNAEKVASRVAAPMQKLSSITSPVVTVLSFSTEAVLRVLRARPTSTPVVTEEELKIMIEEGTQFGVFREAERDMVEHVFRLDDRRVSTLMTHRTDIVWLDVDDAPEDVACVITDSLHSRFPVAQGDLDNVIGIVHAKDLLACGLTDQTIDLQAVLVPPLFVPEGTPALKVLELFKEHRLHIALVIDEFGGVQGLVTANDILEAIVGDMPVVGERFEPEAVQRPDGSWLLDGLLTVDEFKELFGSKELPGEAQGHFETLGGFVMKRLGRIPSVADRFEWGGLHFEVVDMDGYRVDKVLVAPVEKEHPPTPAT
jgi:putative hemolysin